MNNINTDKQTFMSHDMVVMSEIASFLPQQDLQHSRLHMLNRTWNQVVKPMLDPSINDNIALRSAVMDADVELVRHLLTYPKVDPICAIWEAANTGNLEIFDILLMDSRMTSDDRYDYMLVVCSHKENQQLSVHRFENNDFYILMCNTYSGAKTNTNNRTINIVQRILQLDKTIDPAQKQSLLLRQAAGSGNLAAVVALLLDGRVNVNACNGEAIWLAMCGGHESVRRVLEEAIH